ncbi:MAG: ribonucleotide-diphosphate reductase subunit beta [Patulibacter sp.]
MAWELPSYHALLEISARGAWDPHAIDLSADRARWPQLPADVRARLLGLFAGFFVGEDAVAEQLLPFERAATSTGLRACLRAQQVEEERHAVAVARLWSAFAEAGRRDLAAAIAAAPPSLVTLFRERLPQVAAGARDDLSGAVALYHGVVEGVVFLAGQSAVAQLAAQWKLPGTAAIFRRIERDERWHIALGVRALADAPDGRTVAAQLPIESPQAAACWGELVDAASSEAALTLLTRRLNAADLLVQEPGPIER